MCGCGIWPQLVSLQGEHKPTETSGIPRAAPDPCGASLLVPGRGLSAGGSAANAAALLAVSPHTSALQEAGEGLCCSPPPSPALKANLCSCGALAAGRLSASQMEKARGLSFLPCSLPADALSRSRGLRLELCQAQLGWMELGAGAGLLHAWLMDLPRSHHQTCSCAGPKGGSPSPWSLLCQAGCAQCLFSLPTHIAKGLGAVEASLVSPGLWGTF